MSIGDFNKQESMSIGEFNKQQSMSIGDFNKQQSMSIGDFNTQQSMLHRDSIGNKEHPFWTTTDSKAYYMGTSVAKVTCELVPAKAAYKYQQSFKY